MPKISTRKYIDEESGEIRDEGVPILFAPKRKNAFYGGWLAMNQEAGKRIANSDLGQFDFRVLLLIMSVLTFENYLYINQAQLARDLGAERQHVNRSLSKLIELGLLEKGPKAGNVTTYRLDPTFVWKGSAKNHHIAIRDRMKTSNISGVVGG